MLTTHDRSHPQSLPVGNLIDLTIDAISYGGDGVARHDGRVVFVPFAAPGDRVRARITETQQRFSRAELTEIRDASASRVEPPCPHFGVCGGCQLQHLSYDAQLKTKRQFVEDALTRIGRIPDPGVDATLPAPAEWNYRHQIQVMTEVVQGNVITGFRCAGSHRLVDIESCPIAHFTMNQALSGFHEWAVDHLQAICKPKDRTGWLRGMEARCSHDGAQVTVCLLASRFHGRDMRALVDAVRRRTGTPVGAFFRTGERRKDQPLVPSKRIDGASCLTADIDGSMLRFSADSFMQANLRATASLMNVVRERAGIRDGMTVVDLYSGTGLFAAVAVQAGARVYTVENSPAAVEDARVNLPEEVTVLHTPATRGLQLLRERGISPDVVILDPPRAGCDSSSLKALTAISPRRMVYVSCDPATQARDVRLLVEAGYQLKSVQPIDLFPQTYHVETVVAIEPRP